MSKPLNYLQSSPVRGQLEPYDSTSPMGWRYLQTTDTLNELKVLIPPGTAAMYEQLLKLETYELGKNPINWARILEIRHLKERMVRKGSKYAKASMTVSKTSSPFKSFILPDDFRVKEMERWFREQQKRASASAVRRSSSSGRQPSVATHLNHNHGQRQCPQCIPSTSGPPPVKWTASGAVPPKSEPLVVHATAQGNASTSSKSKLYSRAQALLSISRTIKPEKVASLPVSNKHTPADPSLSRSSVVVSPPPLPVILRGQRSAFGLDDETGQAESALGDPELPESLSDDSPPPAPLKDITADEIPRSAQSSPSGDDTSPNPNGVARRRSCIKRGSVSELGGKTVSWADDQELHNQMSRYTSVVRDAQASGHQWEEIRDIYLEQISSLEALQLQVQDGLECLKSESEHLQHVDGTIRRQRERLRLTFDELERKQSAFSERVKEALEQADDVMSRHGLRKTSLPITNE
ncbi:hypothetical protein AGABI1DRAFT_103959 [Agaricus bisporus var. burnettii JB137-S8]|uniref:Uncharacterized protein n=1 Tax=Agaricus bisporus var. burnettii (strain JB137-S8 / ATCC MYA-4627 / FGSC 10392) TaxID=597362 RepID=K5XKK4_AGABU|nr:uncharacterized protein AGABI1DRAFT_103959 [Agaricus bisporus var. burnettii JB137-S8]EKM83912.1 hypothetical protein AGABI1DRAFT_103959 [Agaricus bisporus var. burnettii JB137-S8]